MTEMPLNEESKIAHPHKAFAIEEGSVAHQNRRLRNYRTCPRHAVRNIDVKVEDQHNGELGCHCCYKRETSPCILICRQSLTVHCGRFLKGRKDILLHEMLFRLLLGLSRERDRLPSASDVPHVPRPPNADRGPLAEGRAGRTPSPLRSLPRQSSFPHAPGDAF